MDVAKTFVMVGSVLMFLGVAAGAFGSHGLSGYFEQFPDLENTYEIAVRYHMFHALALLAVGWVSMQWNASWASWAGYLFLIGILIFSGSLYLLVMTRTSWLGAITPLGGLALLAGWVALFIAVWRG